MNTSCADIRAAILRARETPEQGRDGQGTELESEAHRSHLATCPACAAIAAAPRAFAEAARAEQRAATPPVSGAKAVLAKIQADHPQRSFKRRDRVALAAVEASPVVVVAFAAGIRPDLGTYPAGRMLLTLGAWLVLMLWSVALTFRPPYRPLVSRRELLAAAALAAATVLVAALSPDAEPDSSAAGSALKCFALGAVSGLCLYLPLLRFDQKVTTRTQLCAAAAAGLLGNIVLQLHCPVTKPDHLLTGHCGAAALCLAMGAVLALRPRRRAASS